MASTPVTHPPIESLQAYNRGTLEDTKVGAVETHLEQCTACREQVEAMSGDKFHRRLPQAYDPSTVGPSKPLPSGDRGQADITASFPGATIPDLPPELANHPQYEILRKLGAGGMGVVYLARHRMSGREEVLKVMNKALLCEPGSKDRFLREIRSVAMLDHPNVVKMHTALELGELTVLVMEYGGAESLADMVKARETRMPVLNACYYIQQAALGLQHAFDKKMVHRDIKPHNLIVSRQGKKHVVKVLDFGLAKVKSEEGESLELTATGQPLGTFAYMAPEQALDSAHADIRADIYSLGCTLYHLIAGRPPFPGQSVVEMIYAHQSLEPEPLDVVRPDVPKALALIVSKMMAKDPAQRYQTPAEVAQVLKAFVKEERATGASADDLLGGSAEVKAEVAPDKSSKQAREPKVKESPERAQKLPGDDLAVGRETAGQLGSSLTDSRKRATSPNRPPSAAQNKRLIGGAVATCVLLIGLVGLWASGVLRVRTKDGIITVEVNEPNADVFVDGEKVTVTWGGGGQRAEIGVKSGTRKVEVKKDGFTVHGEEVTLEEGGRKLLTARLEPVAKAALPQDPIARQRRHGSGTSKERSKAALPQDPSAKQQPAEAGFVPLFNGKDLTGWHVESGDAHQWSTEGEAIVGRSANSRDRNYLLSNGEYSDFTLRLEFMIDPGSNGAIGLRAIEGEKLLGSNARIVDHPNIKLTDSARFAKYPLGTTRWLNDNRLDHMPNSVPKLPTGSWHPMEITVHGDTCVATVGPEQVVNLKLDPDPSSSGRFVPALKRAKGKIGFQAHTGTVRFRKIEINELPPDKGLPKKNAAQDGLQPGSVWKGMSEQVTDGINTRLFPVTVTILSRDDKAFSARSDTDAGSGLHYIREFHGTVDGGKVHWSGKDVKIILVDKDFKVIRVDQGEKPDYDGVVSGEVSECRAKWEANGKSYSIVAKLHLEKK